MSTVEQILEKERKNIKTDVRALSEFLYTPQALPNFIRISSKPPFPYDPNFFNKSRVDMILQSHRQAPGNLQNILSGETAYQNVYLTYIQRAFYQVPYSIHISMFVQCLEMMGTQYQQQQWTEKAKRYQITGCYAQTQLGHGSDVQNLQTTATYNVENNSFIMNTPTISAAKWWPGDMGVLCTHAIVFAQMIIRKKNYGVHGFIVPVRDVNTLKVLPGIQVGDIGPKIGFSTKDNGYLIMKNIQIPKWNMLRKFVSVSDTGQMKRKGDPKVSYATMMIIRQSLSSLSPKVYAMPIIIAARYSLFRTQFLDSQKKQIPIIDYQTQKDKILSRVAQFFAVCVGGQAIKQLSDRNLTLVRDQSDFSLMKESHICLCVGKALYGQIVYDGMQICRRACGGHGFSHYSGIPSMILEYASNLTLQGQNTILYLQIARFLLKNYKNAMTGKKTLGESVRYIENINDILDQRIEANRDDWKNWALADLQLLLSQAVCYLLSQAAAQIVNKPPRHTDLDVWNKLVGVQLKRLSVCHSVYYTYENFKNAVERQNNPQNKTTLVNLCLLFGINSLDNFSSAVVEGGFITPAQISSLHRLRQHILDAIRPQLVGLLDSFLVPEHLLKSALTHGDPYKNYLDLARKCELNHKTIQAAHTIRNNIKRVISNHTPEPKL